jgi:hypothetical protein
VEIEQIVNWLIADQFAHGEWGKCEIKDPTSQPRTLNDSQMKPNVFTSCQTAYALVACVGPEAPSIKSFTDWMDSLRDEEGFWRSAAGSPVPMGGGRGWSSAINVRHTAKGLDLLLLQDRFCTEDAEVLHYILDTQGEDGSFPQVIGGDSDIWATAYAMNLLIRALCDSRAKATAPRRKDPQHWSSELTSKLSRARNWICSKTQEHGLWDLPGFGPEWTSRAIIAEIGGDLAVNRPDIAAAIGGKLAQKALSDWNAVTLWGMLLMLNSLPADLQSRVVAEIERLKTREQFDNDTFAASCMLRLLRVADNPWIIEYYKSQSCGHESCLPMWRRWSADEYEQWCVRQAAQIRTAAAPETAYPTSKVQAWATVLHLVDEFRQEVEFGRGWELLWNGSKHRDEKAVQVAFSNMARPVCARMGISIAREIETGRGPVDFSFNNGVRVRVHLEFKNTDSSRLMHGLEMQLPEYTSADNVDSAVYVCVGFDDAGKDQFEKVLLRLREVQNLRPNLFIRAEFIDARKKPSASHI